MQLPAEMFAKRSSDFFTYGLESTASTYDVRFCQFASLHESLASSFLIESKPLISFARDHHANSKIAYTIGRFSVRQGRGISFRFKVSLVLALVMIVWHGVGSFECDGRSITLFFN